MQPHSERVDWGQIKSVMLKVVNYTTERVSGEDPSQGKGRSGNFSIAKTMILQEQFVLGCL